MTTPMIQRMAEAMAREGGWEPGFGGDAYLGMAGAALEAMREPPPGMVGAMWCSLSEAEMPEDAERAFTAAISAAIDAALQESKG